MAAGSGLITSSNAGALQELHRPVFSLPFSTYLVLWIVLGLAAIGGLAFLARPLL